MVGGVGAEDTILVVEKGNCKYMCICVRGRIL